MQIILYKGSVFVNKDLTVGKPQAVLWRFCLPMFGSILFQQLYNIADSFVAGKFIDNDALAAVGNSYEITLIFLAFAFGVNIGCSVVVSRLYGSRDYRSMKSAVTTSLLSCGVLCLLLMGAGFLLSDTLLTLIHTPSNVFADSKTYLDIYILGLPFVFFYNVATGIFSALGDSKTPFYFLAASSLSNIGLDILFVAAFGMRVEGVAYATLLCQGVSCVLAVLFVFRRLAKVEAGEKAPVFSLPLFREIARIAVPSILQQSFISVGNIVIQSVINTFGSGVMAGYSASVKLNNMVITSLTTLGNGISNFTAQNLGAGKMLRVREGYRAGLLLVWLLSLPITLLYLLLGAPLVSLFLENAAGEALSTGVLFLRILSPFYLIVSTKLATDGVLRGAGEMKKFMIATFTDLFLRVALAEVLSLTPLGITGVWLSWPIGWAVGTGLSLLFYRSMQKKRLTALS